MQIKRIIIKDIVNLAIIEFIEYHKGLHHIK